MTTSANTQSVRFSALLRRVWPRDAAKHAAMAAQCSVRTAQKWMADICSPSSDALIRMARANGALRAEIEAAMRCEATHEHQEGGGMAAGRAHLSALEADEVGSVGA